MGEEFKKLIKPELDAAAANGKAEGKNTDKVEIIREWMNDTDPIPESKIIQYSRITIAQFKAIVEMIRKHKDWDASKVACDIKWDELA